MKKHILFALFLLLLTSTVHAAEITASVNRSPVPQGEVFMLTLHADENLKEQPDLTVLNPDFKVYSTSVSRHHYMVNGQLSAATEWKIGLMALKSGRQQIPAISVGSSHSRPLNIEVTNAAEASQWPSVEKPAAKYALQTEIVAAPREYYVQQQLNYNVILTDAGGLQGGEPVFETANHDWLIVSLSQPEIAVQTINNQTQRTITYKYALFAQKSGNLQIPAVTFDGYALTDAPAATFNLGGNSLFNIGINMQGLFNVEQPISLQAPGRNIEVLPVPAGYGKKWWLPAQEVKLTARFEDADTSFKQGEAFRYQVKLEAAGLTFNQLPEINFPQSSSFKQYPEKSAGQDEIRQGRIIGERTATHIFVPEEAGVLTIPEMRVDWYNITTGTIETAVLPARQINVEANPLLQKATANAVSAAKSEASAPVQFQPAKPLTKPMDQYFSYLWVLGAFVAGLLLSRLLMLRRPAETSKPQCETRRFPNYIVEKAYQNDYRSLRDGLITWATGYFPHRSISNLKDVAAAVDDPAFGAQIDILINKLYNSDDTVVFNAKSFADSFKKALKHRARAKKPTQPLPPLYD